MIKLFAMDLDGTTLDSNSRLDERIIDGLRKLDKNGVKFVFTSGRAKPSVDYLTSLTGLDNPTIANNGAIASISKDEVIYENSLTYKDLEKLVDFCEGKKLFYQFYDHNTYYSNRLCQERFKHLKLDTDYGMNYQVNFSFSTNPIKEIKAKNNKALKFQIFPTAYDRLSKDEIVEQIRILNKNLYITASHDRVIEIMQKNVSKYQAICEICDYLGINNDEIASIGDQDNDIPMLKYSKLSFAMKNSIDKVKEVSDFVVASNDEFGLLEAIDIVLEKNSQSKPKFNIALLSPEHPGNVGNIARTCVLTESKLHLIRPFKFDFSDKALKKAGIDYWDKLDLLVHNSFDEFLAYVKDKNIYLIETGTDKNYNEINFKDGDYLVFGREKEGIDKNLLEKYKDRVFTIPMTKKIDRSLNLANSVAIVIYEALRQNNFFN